MKKNGFTLTELLTVIAIIGLIALIAVPSIIKISKRSNERLFENKIELIESAAELYATNNPDIFNENDEVYIYVAELIDKDYLKVDKSDDDCIFTTINGISIRTDGCVTNPKDNSSLNKYQIKLTQKASGVTAEFILDLDNSNSDTSQLLTDGDLLSEVCRRFETNIYVGSTVQQLENCSCRYDGESEYYIYNLNNDIVDDSIEECVIVGEYPDNYIEFNGVMWRVMGLYKDEGELKVKVISSAEIDVE